MCLSQHFNHYSSKRGLWFLALHFKNSPQWTACLGKSCINNQYQLFRDMHGLKCWDDTLSDPMSWSENERLQYEEDSFLQCPSINCPYLIPGLLLHSLLLLSTKSWKSCFFALHPATHLGKISIGVTWPFMQVVKHKHGMYCKWKVALIRLWYMQEIDTLVSTFHYLKRFPLTRINNK